MKSYKRKKLNNKDKKFLNKIAKNRHNPIIQNTCSKLKSFIHLIMSFRNHRNQTFLFCKISFRNTRYFIIFMYRLQYRKLFSNYEHISLLHSKYTFLTDPTQIETFPRVSQRIFQRIINFINLRVKFYRLPALNCARTRRYLLFQLHDINIIQRNRSDRVRSDWIALDRIESDRILPNRVRSQSFRRELFKRARMGRGIALFPADYVI